VFLDDDQREQEVMDSLLPTRVQKFEIYYTQLTSLIMNILAAERRGIKPDFANNTSNIPNVSRETNWLMPNS
jgi:hypothetical protein